MKKIISVFVLLLVSSAAHAQVYKCKNAQGKMEYSDVPCAGQDSQKLNIVAPSFGGDHGPGGDPNARALKILEADRIRSDPTPIECKFKHYKSDSKGKVLADNATAECIENMVRKSNGQPISLDAHNTWKEHHDMTTSNRNALAANRNAQRMNQQLDELRNKTYRCKRSSMPGRLDCQ